MRLIHTLSTFGLSTAAVGTIQSKRLGRMGVGMPGRHYVVLWKADRQRRRFAVPFAEQVEKISKRGLVRQSAVKAGRIHNHHHHHRPTDPTTVLML